MAAYLYRPEDFSNNFWRIFRIILIISGGFIVYFFCTFLLPVCCCYKLENNRSEIILLRADTRYKIHYGRMHKEYFRETTTPLWWFYLLCFLSLDLWFLFLFDLWNWRSDFSFLYPYVRSLELFGFWFLFSGVCVRFLFLIDMCPISGIRVFIFQYRHWYVFIFQYRHWYFDT